MHLKQEAQGLYSPQTILEKKVHSLLKINFFFGLELVLPFKKNGDNASMVPILQSASVATWNHMVTGDKDLWEGRGQC